MEKAKETLVYNSNYEKKQFTHLHVHTGFSLLDGSAHIKDLVSRTKELGMDALAITDHGVMYGVIDFYKACLEEDIKPILGCEVYVSSGSRHNKENSKDNFYYHLILLAENDIGYHNLMKITSIGFTEGFYYKPRVDIETLRRYSEGIIATSACIAGPVAKNLLNSTYEKAKETAVLYNEIFGQDNFFLELQDHGMTEQEEVNPKLIKIARETGIPLICTNDLHYILSEDAAVHDVLICIQTNKTVDDEDRMRYEGEQFYLKSPEEMYEIFSYIPEALENTNKIAERCNVEIKFNEYKLPKYDLPEGINAYDYLIQLCREGLDEKYEEITDEIEKRLLYELDVINNMGFLEYFLVVWDFIKFAKDNGIYVGPGRGSAAGCIVAYSLGITNIDPIKYDLLFERFLNPERISMPDIDIDFCYERRQEVIDYVIEKYGADHVAQIITFGTLAAKGVVRDVGRALGMSYQDCDRIAKMIPFALNMTLELAMEINNEMRDLYETDDRVRYLIDTAKKLVGLPRHASTHAAGVVICNKPVSEYVPLNQNDGVVTTQFPMNTIEELGLLKMDFLGLRTLTVIGNAVAEIERIHKKKIDINTIDMTDQKVFALISAAKTEGVFQLESDGMKNFMKELCPSCIDDMIAGISLYRPGPMDFIPKYIKGKNNANTIKYPHPSLEPILKSTYGCIVYQEQVMQIVRDLGGYSMGRSDLVRRAMSKKKSDVMAQERNNFINGLPGSDVLGCVAKGIPASVAEQIFNEMTDFAKYAFNKSHAAAYAIIGYQTAWLKTYYPVEFMAALLTSVMDSTSKIVEYINECKKINIEVLPPDINEGYGYFSVSKGRIRYGLNAIKNVGRNVIKAMIEERNKNGAYVGLSEFVLRLDGRDMNRRSLESLIFAGVFDSLGGKRLQYINIYEQVLSGVTSAKKYKMDGQLDLFGLSEDNDKSAEKDLLPENIGEYPLKELLSHEKDVLGIYLTGHPIKEYAEILQRKTNCTSVDFYDAKTDLDSFDENIVYETPAKLYDGKEVIIGGLISARTNKFTKNNNQMAFITIEDLYGAVEIIVFPNKFDRYNPILTIGTPILVEGKASIRENEASKILADDIRVIRIDKPQIEQNDGRKLWLKIPVDKNISFFAIKSVLASSRGNTPVIIYEEKTKQKLTVSSDLAVDINDKEFILRLNQLLGEENIKVK